MPTFRFCPRCGHELPAPTVPAARLVRQDCPACGAVHYRNAKPTASALVVQDGKVLLGRRCIEPFKGWWDVPGGFLEPWEHPAEGVVREIAEETGLAVRPTELLGIFMDVYAYGEDDDYTLNVYYLVEIVGGEPRPGDDLMELRFFTPDELPDQVAFATGRQALAEWKRRQEAGRQGPRDRRGPRRP